MKNIFLIIFMGLIVTSCVETKDEIETEVDRIIVSPNSEELRKRTRELIEDSDKLTREQKDSFLKLHTKSTSQVDVIEDRMKKLQLVLVQHLAEEEYNSDKLIELKKQLIKLNNQKIEVMVNSMTDAKKILGVEFKNFHPRPDYGIK